MIFFVFSLCYQGVYCEDNVNVTGDATSLGSWGEGGRPAGTSYYYSLNGLRISLYKGDEKVGQSWDFSSYSRNLNNNIQMYSCNKKNYPNSKLDYIKGASFEPDSDVIAGKKASGFSTLPFANNANLVCLATDGANKYQILKEHFKQEKNKQYYLQIFLVNQGFADNLEQAIELWNTSDYKYLVEPFGVYNINIGGKDISAVLTAPELAILSQKESINKNLYSIQKSGFYALAFTTYLETNETFGSVTIQAYKGQKKQVYNDKAMVSLLKTQLGCMSISANDNPKQNVVQQNTSSQNAVHFYTDIDVITSVDLHDDTGFGFPKQSKNPGSGQDADAKTRARGTSGREIVSLLKLMV